MVGLQAQVWVCWLWAGAGVCLDRGFVGSVCAGLGVCGMGEVCVRRVAWAELGMCRQGGVCGRCYGCVGWNWNAAACTGGSGQVASVERNRNTHKTRKQAHAPPPPVCVLGVWGMQRGVGKVACVWDG